MPAVCAFSSFRVRAFPPISTFPPSASRRPVMFSDPITLSFALSLCVCVCLRSYPLLSSPCLFALSCLISPSAHCSRRLLRCQGMKEGRKDVSSEMSFTLRFFFSLLPLRSSFNGHLSFWLTFGNVRRASRSVLLSLVDRRALRKELCLSRRRSDTPCNHTTYDVVRSHTTGRNSFTDIFVVLSHTLRFRMVVHMGV